MRALHPLWLLLGMAAVARAEEPTEAHGTVAIEDARAFLASATNLVLADAPIYVSTPLVLTNGPMKATLTSGYVVPVHSGGLSGPWVGFLWVRGTGDVELSFPEPGQALRFAMRMVRDGGDVEALRPIAHQEAPFRTTADQGLVLGATSDVTAVLEAYRLEKERLEADVGLVVTVAGEQVLGEAAALFRERMRTWDLAEVDVAELVALDRMRRDLYGSDNDGSFVLAEIDIAAELPLEAEEQTVLTDSDPEKRGKRLERLGSHWLSTLRDDTGDWDARNRVDAFALIAFAREDVVFSHFAGEPFPPLDPLDPLSPPAPTNRLVGDIAVSTLKVQPWARDAMRLQVQVESRLVLKADGACSVVRFEVPRGITDKGMPVDIALTVDGHDVVLILPGEDRRTTTVALPRTVADGEEVVVEARFIAYWPYGQGGQLSAAGGGTVEGIGVGVSSGLRSYIPAPAGSFTGNPWRFRTTVGVPPQEKLTVALAGETEEVWTDRVWEWTEAAHEDSPALWPQVAVGKWSSVTEAPYQDLPGVRVHLFNGQKSVLTSFGPEIRRQVIFFTGFLPPFPYPEVEVFEDTGALSGFVWIAPHGMVQVKKAFMMESATGAVGGGLRDDAPHLENAVLAHEVAHQYWGHVARPTSVRDFWIAETFAEGFACMYVAAAFTKRDCVVRMKAKREVWERDLKGTEVRGSLTDAYLSPFKSDIVYGYGPYVMFEMLQRRIGTAAFFAALDGMLRDRWEQPITTEALQAYFEATSGMELDDFFLFWVHGGYVPEIRIDWWTEPSASGHVWVAGTVTADVAFGTFDFPIRVELQDGTAGTVSVTVVDGVGQFRTEAPGEPRKVLIDPEDTTLLRARTVRKVSP